MISTNINGLEIEQIYRLNAKDFFELLTDHNRLTYHASELRSYLQNRLQNCTSQDPKHRKTEACQLLSSNFVRSCTTEDLNVDSLARIIYYFPRAVENNCIYRIRKELGCYFGTLKKTEQSYTSPLQHVTREEFFAKWDLKYDSIAIRTMKLEESKKLALDILLFVKD